VPAIGNTGVEGFFPQGTLTESGATPPLTETEQIGKLLGLNFGQISKLPVEEQRVLRGIGSPGQTINIGPNGEQYGDPGKGLVWQRGPDGTVMLDDRGAPIAIPFQGGEVWTGQQQAQDKAAIGAQQRQTTGDLVVQDIDRAIGMINDSPWLTTGLVGQASSGIGSTPAFDVQALLDPVLSNIGFDKLQAMRNASPTGGALGQVAVQELEMLQAAIGSLKMGQSQPQQIDNLKRIKNIYLDIIHGSGNGPPREILSFDKNNTAPGGQVSPNPSADPLVAPPGAGGGVARPRAVNPQTGQAVEWDGAQWVPVQ
jgi:hypothetical protein